MDGRIQFDAAFGRRSQRRQEGEPMRLLLLGDFSGKAPAERAPLGMRPIHRVDIDNVDAVLRRLEPRITLPSGEIRVDAIDDFHPDRLFARLAVFDELRKARATPPVRDDDQVARLLGKLAPPPPKSAAPATGVDALIRDAVAPHIVRDTSAATAAHLAAVDAAIALEMRSLLHAPAFQAVEAAWRGIRWLVSNLELDENLQLHLFDVAREELVADIGATGGAPTDTQFYQAIVGRSQSAVDGERWSAIAGLLRFGPTDADMSLLSALGLIASRAGGSWLADADAALADDPGFAGWRALRRSEAARSIALGAPRVLLRLPYGRCGDPIDAFPFEEFAGPPENGELLWGHASLALALLLGRAFSARGWDMEPGDERDIGDLPAWTFERDGERQLQPCAERGLNEREVDAFLRAGIVPIASRRDRDEVVVVRFQSVADPPAPLAW